MYKKLVVEKWRCCTACYLRSGLRICVPSRFTDMVSKDGDVADGEILKATCMSMLGSRDDDEVGTVAV
jgi:hypothetical protein